MHESHQQKPNALDVIRDKFANLRLHIILMKIVNGTRMIYTFVVCYFVYHATSAFWNPNMLF